ncbi:nucleosome binding protein [Colletotrichum tofieldiae]|uniref:Nucleosome binding protein n=1 Tax=Colletotrichum tofieldiae TaxID=708197 RepID=A0A166UZL8_9PEZI|nr:nucleosome binding protein [Colletotrichum tofieldiae]GKT93321.1 nucleosome binding protein [Colletotrichum tofieldiae]
MTSPSSIVTLRRLEIFAFPPAFILLIAHGVASERAFPALGLLPLAASAVLAAFILNRDAVAAIGSPIQSLSESNIFWADCLLAVFHLAFLIPSWALLTQPWHEPLIVLGTYCTVFMMFDLGVHLFIALPQALHLLISRSCTCPHCRTVAKTGFFSSTVSEYTPLSDDDGETEPEIVARDIEEGSGNVRL